MQLANEHASGTQSAGCGGGGKIFFKVKSDVMVHDVPEKISL